MGNFVSNLRNSWSENTSGVAGILLTVITGMLTAAGGVLLYYDLSASYYGWGKLVETDMNMPNSTILALCITALPTLVQLAWSMANVANHDLAKHTGVNVLFWIMLAIDTALDMNQVVTGTTASWIMSSVVVIIGFGFASEFLIAFMGSSFIGMARSLISSPALWDPNKAGSRRSGRGGGGMPLGPSRRPSTQSRPSPSRTRRDPRATGRPTMPSIFEEMRRG